MGIFQWATTRARPDAAGSSLAWFFAGLRARAASEPLAATAWGEARAAGLDLRAGALRLDGRAATGALLEGRLGPVMGRGALRTWQLVAANASVDRIASRRVAGRRVDQLLPSPRGLATAVLLGVNRPAWVVPCLEAALHEADATDEESLLAAFRRAAIARYPAAQRERRAMRLFTSESL